MTTRMLDVAIYAVHAAFWGTFGVTLLIHRSLDRGIVEKPGAPPVAGEERTARFSRALLAVHMLAFFVMYFGIGNAVIPGLVPHQFPGQRWVGACVIASGAALMSWALVYFRSWRFRAKIDQGHQLATGGPFRYLRHPIYMGMNLLALGTAIWVPTAIVWIACGLMVIGSDLRARAEEHLLAQTFGSAYRAYCLRTRRFLPGIY